MADDHLYRGQRAAQHDRRRDHRAGRQLALQDQIGPQPQHRRLYEQPERLGQCGIAACRIRGTDTGPQRPVARHLPAVKGRAAHTQRMDHLAFLPDLAAQLVRGKAGRIGLRQRCAGGDLVQHGDNNQHQRAADGQQPHQRMKDKDAKEKQRRPRQVKHRHQRGRGDQPLHGFQIAQAGGGLPWRALQGRGAHDGGENAPVQPGLKPRTDPRHHAAADVIQHRHHRIQKRHQHSERNQRFHRPRVQHAVIDVQHVKRAGQHQQVDEKAERADDPAQWRAFADCRAQFCPSLCHCSLCHLARLCR